MFWTGEGLRDPDDVRHGDGLLALDLLLDRVVEEPAPDEQGEEDSGAE
jgi:hypothetical protein